MRSFVTVLTILLLILFDVRTPSADNTTPANSNRYKIVTSEGQTFLIDGATGQTWRWVWTEADTPDCKLKKQNNIGVTDGSCRYWFWSGAFWKDAPNNK